MQTQSEDAVLMSDQASGDAANPNDDGQRRPGQLTEEHWDLLLSRIYYDPRDPTGRCRCTPLIGGAACAGMDQLRLKIVEILVKEHEDYPFPRTGDLARAAQFVAVREDKASPYDAVADAMKSSSRGLTDSYHLYRGLASLPFPLYITTNYHDLMAWALRGLPNPKDARTEYCRWDPETCESDVDIRLGDAI